MFDYIPFPVLTHTAGMTHFQNTSTAFWYLAWRWFSEPKIVAEFLILFANNVVLLTEYSTLLRYSVKFPTSNEISVLWNPHTKTKHVNGTYKG